MKRFSIADISESLVRAHDYDLAIFADGYEQRCLHAFSRLDRTKISRTAVIGFNEQRGGQQRILNTQQWEDNTGQLPTLSSASDDTILLNILRTLDRPSSRPTHILVDYSSMPRAWFVSIINWARFAKGNIILDYVYSIGAYDASYDPYVIDGVYALPGFEGRSAPFLRTVGVVGMGFEAASAMTAIDMLELDELYAFLASPGAFPDYPERTQLVNDELIKTTVNQSAWGLPLRSVEQTYSFLAEVAGNIVREANLSLLTVGPKPHALAAIAVGLRVPEVTCLRLKIRDLNVKQVTASGEIIATRLSFHD